MTKPEFNISILDWLQGEFDSPEVNATEASLSITVNGRKATSVLAKSGKTTREHIYASAYPLAFWLAENWWRLRWEPSLRPADASWLFAHHTQSAGFGYVWPDLTITSDGEVVRLQSCNTAGTAAEPIQYLSRFDEDVPAPLFEKEVERFITDVLDRLDAMGLTDTDLHELWGDVRAERADQEDALFRKTEAFLGGDPDELSEDVVRLFLGFGAEIGVQAALELAIGAPAANRQAYLGELKNQAGMEGHAATMRCLVRSDFRDILHGSKAPWEKGWELARQARKALKLGVEPIDGHRLAELIEAPDSIWVDTPSKKQRFGLAIREQKGEGMVKLLLEKKDMQGRRFEAARLMADHLLSPDDLWLPATGSKTARQKIQRAFAAEFLCPFEIIEKEVGDEPTESTVAEIADHYQVATAVVAGLLVNRNVVEREDLQYLVS
jgi:hypothetical protein